MSPVLYCPLVHIRCRVSHQRLTNLYSLAWTHRLCKVVTAMTDRVITRRGWDQDTPCCAGDSVAVVLLRWCAFYWSVLAGACGACGTVHTCVDELRTSVRCAWQHMLGSWRSVRCTIWLLSQRRMCYVFPPHPSHRFSRAIPRCSVLALAPNSPKRHASPYLPMTNCNETRRFCNTKSCASKYARRSASQKGQQRNATATKTHRIPARALGRLKGAGVCLHVSALARGRPVAPGPTTAMGKPRAFESTGRLRGRVVDDHAPSPLHRVSSIGSRPLHHELGDCPQHARMRWNAEERGRIHVDADTSVGV
jgi:hypothetical protein